MATTDVRTDAAKDIVDLSTEIWSYHSTQPLDVSVDVCAEGLAMPGRESEYLKLPFYVAAETLSEPLHAAPAAQEPRFRLTRRVLDFARHIGKRHMPPIGDPADTSLYEEFAFATSIAYHQYAASRDDAPGIILHDIHDNAAGYQKPHGAPVSYIWRDAFMATEAGTRLVPKDSLVRLVYRHGAELHHQLHGMGIVAVKGYRPLDIEFLRFTVGSLPGKLYSTILSTCLARQPGLTPYVTGVRRLDPILTSLRLSRLITPERVVSAR